MLTSCICQGKHCIPCNPGKVPVHMYLNPHRSAQLPAGAHRKRWFLSARSVWGNFA